MPGLRRRPSRACIRTCPASVNLQAGANVCMKFSCCKTNVGATTKVIYSVVPKMLDSEGYSRQSVLFSGEGSPMEVSLCVWGGGGACV